MANRVVSTKLTEEEHQKLVDVCGVSGQTPSAFIREMIKQALLTKFSQSKIHEEPKELNNLTKEDNSTTLIRESSARDDGTNPDSLVSLTNMLDTYRKRRHAITERNLKCGDMLDGKVVAHCSKCGELH